MYSRISSAPGRSRNAATGEPANIQPQTVKVQKRMSGHRTDICLSFSIISLPPLAFSALLLGLVYFYRVSHTTTASDDLRTPDMIDEPGVYYVNLSATVLIFIASWSSSLAPLLVGFIMNLASYPISRQFWKDIQTQQSSLPTPYQFALVIKFIASGGWGALYNWIEYLAGWKKQRQIQSRVLTASASITLLATFLGLIVFLADTWLHITTSTIDFLQTNPITSTRNHSLILRQACLGFNGSGVLEGAGAGCNLEAAAVATYLADSAQSLRTLNNMSDTVAVFNNGPDPTYTYLGVPASGDLADQDFTATTFSMRTECKPISNECNVYAHSGGSTPFWCTNDFMGDLTSSSSSSADGWFDAYFANQSMKLGGDIQNPYYYGLAAIIKDLGISALSPTEPNSTVPEVVTPVHGGVAFVLLCSITLYDTEYDSINGTITRFVTKPSNDSVANIWQAPVAYTNIAELHLKIAASIASSIAKDAQDLADQIALAYSKIGLAVGAQSVRAAPALAVQERSSFLVTRLPVAPLFSLIAANLAFVLLGIVLTGIALRTCMDEVREIQPRLSIVGLVADRFEGARANSLVGEMSELFEEHEGKSTGRVVIDRSMSGGYRYRQWSTMQ